MLVKGGDYQFEHCTVASYSNNYITHKDPVLFISNYLTVNNIPQPAPLTALFRNCIFWGEGGFVEYSDEVRVLKEGNTSPYSVVFDHVLWKILTNDPATIAGVTAAGIINNESPQFDSINVSKNYYDFHLQATSPAIKNGTNTIVAFDLDGSPRPAVSPDLGCYQKQ